jgi:hypothetical protein
MISRIPDANKVVETQVPDDILASIDHWPISVDKPS